MRQIQILVSEDHREEVTDLLNDEGIDYVRQRAWVDDDEQWLIEFPVPTDAIGYIFDQLDETGIEQDRYTVVTSVETATTPHTESLRDRFASDFDPLTESELRSKALDMSRDTRSFLAMIFLSTIIATAGLLVESPAVVVGSMVIAPIVGPVLTASVGAVTGDREMLVHSTWLQAAGLAVAILGAWVFSVGLQLGGFVPESLDISSIDLIALRIAPSVTTVAIGLAAGAAGAFGLTTKGPTSLIGVMIAAALIPAAATVGIAAGWNELRIAAGSLLLLVLTMILINVSAYVMLRGFDYRPDQQDWLFGSASSVQRLALVGTTLVLLAVVVLSGIASYQQIAFERSVNEEVQSTLDESDYESLKLVAIQIQYSGVGPFGSPETITLTVSRTDDGDPPEVAGEFDRRITEVTGHDVQVRIQFLSYQRSDDNEPSQAVNPQRVSQMRNPATPLPLLRS